MAAIESAVPEIDILASSTGKLTLEHMKDMENNDLSPFGARGFIPDVEWWGVSRSTQGLQTVRRTSYGTAPANPVVPSSPS